MCTWCPEATAWVRLSCKSSSVSGKSTWHGLRLTLERSDHQSTYSPPTGLRFPALRLTARPALIGCEFLSSATVAGLNFSRQWSNGPEWLASLPLQAELQQKGRQTRRSVPPALYQSWMLSHNIQPHIQPQNAQFIRSPHQNAEHRSWSHTTSRSHT